MLYFFAETTKFLFRTLQIMTALSSPISRSEVTTKLAWSRWVQGFACFMRSLDVPHHWMLEKYSNKILIKCCLAIVWKWNVCDGMKCEMRALAGWAVQIWARHWPRWNIMRRYMTSWDEYRRYIYGNSPSYNVMWRHVMTLCDAHLSHNVMWRDAHLSHDVMRRDAHLSPDVVWRHATHINTYPQPQKDVWWRHNAS